MSFVKRKIRLSYKPPPRLDSWCWSWFDCRFDKSIEGQFDVPIFVNLGFLSASSSLFRTLEDPVSVDALLSCRLPPEA